MGCTHLCDKKLQKIEGDNLIDENYNKNDKVLIININDLANQNPFLKIIDDFHKKQDIETQKVLKDPHTYFFLFGENCIKMQKEFLEIYQKIFLISMELSTTFYTLSYQEVKNIVEELKLNVKPPIISENLYSFLVNNKTEIFGYSEYKNIYKEIYEIFIDKKDFQKEIIISTMKFIMLHSDFNDNIITYSMIKLFQDIGFCIRILFYNLKSKLLHNQYVYEYDFDIRILYFLNLIESLSYRKKYPSNLLELATESSKVKDTIILGDKGFRKHIKTLKLENERISDLDDNLLDSFFQKPFLLNKKYKIVKYFVICEEKDYKEKYLDKFKSLSSQYGFAYLFLVYVKNKKLSDIIIDLSEQNSVIYFFDDSELKEIYKDNNQKLRPRLRAFLPENYSEFKLENIKFEKEMIYDQIQDLKLNSEDGWDLFEFEKESFNFRFVFKSNTFQDFIRHILGNIINAYKDHNTLEIFFRYYSNYFFLTLQPEFVVNMTAFAKMFLYAYTLEEGNPNENLYCVVNDDLRSNNPEKVNRFAQLIKVIGALIKYKELKSYNGIVYRASFLKEELIKNIKIGDTIINSAFWSASKKESVAKKFMKNGRKNALIITKGELINNVDIHIEKMSRYPNEEEVLYLPFCNFKIKSFEKIKEDKLTYYKLELESVSQTSLFKPYSKEDINRFNCIHKEEEEEDDENIFKIKINIE